MFIACFTSLLAFAATLSRADYSFTAPTQGSTYAVTSSITVGFEDDGDAPAFSDIKSTKVLLCTGPNTAIKCFDSYVVGSFVPTSSQTTYVADISSLATVGSNGPYYFQFYSTATAGGYSIHYTSRFNLTGMSGTVKASDGGFTVPPDGSSSVGSTSTVDITKMNTIPYLSQTGRTRYAPMQMQPGTKVTHALSASRRFPVSSVTYFSNYKLKPEVKTTMTPSWSYTIKQGPNWAATQSQPTGYYGAQEALQRTINAKSRRGYIEL